MTNIVITVKNGVVVEVAASNAETYVTVIDLDSVAVGDTVEIDGKTIDINTTDEEFEEIVNKWAPYNVW